LSNRKSQHSILVLATLGVYLGLVLVGAAPQVLAQAAMTRQFDVRDEIEFKEDLDTKPDPVPDGREAVQPDERVSRSVNAFLAQFKQINSLTASLALEEPTAYGIAALYRRSTFVDRTTSFHITPIGRIISVSNFARAAIDPLACS
jgi:hypothetical protein